MSKKRILVVEDEAAILMGLRETLEHEGYEVLTATTGPEALARAMETQPDLMLLDLMLPGKSGFEVCRELRDAGRQMPIIMLTARQDEFDKVHGFEMGADDYVTKPFSVRELMARIHANLLRGRRREETAAEYAFGDFVLDMQARILRRRPPLPGAPRRRVAKLSAKAADETVEAPLEVPLTKTEFDLLAYFCANEGKALSRDRVMNDVWGMEYYGTQRSLDSFVASLRHKIEADSANPRHILTVHGVGYKFRR